jgi:hypothetical protein
MNPWFTPSRFLPVGAAAVALLAFTLVWQNPPAPVTPAAAVVLNDLDLLLEGENLDFFEELEFYAWLLEQPELLKADADGDDNG